MGLISAAALSACGGGNSSPAPAVTTPVAPAPAPVVPAPAPDPVVPAPVNPAPVNPAPVNPVPVPPAPVIPVPTPPVPDPLPVVPTPAPTPASTYKAPVPTVGDFTTYTDVTNGYAMSSTIAVTKLRSGGGWETSDSASQEKGAPTIDTYDASGGMLTTSSMAGCTATYAPAAMQLPASASVGQGFDYASTLTVPCSMQEQLRALTTKGNVAAVESKTVPAGTFSTFKTVVTQTNFDLRPANAQTVNYWTEKTCWHDAVSGLTVACESKTRTAVDGPVVISSTTLLASYANAASKTSFLDPIRFAGPWSGDFGTYYGSCKINSSAKGVLSGSCQAPGRISAVSGSIDKAGLVSLVLTAPGMAAETNSGNASLFEIKGQFAGPSASGSWTLKHN